MTDLEKVTAQRDLLLDIARYAHTILRGEINLFSIDMASSHLDAAIKSVEKEMNNAR